MQAYLPSSRYIYSAEALSKNHLGNQCDEIWQMLKMVEELEKEIAEGRQNLPEEGIPPGVRCWVGYARSLCNLGRVCCQIWHARFNQEKKVLRNLTGWYDKNHIRFWGTLQPMVPYWMGEIEIHASHRRVLLKKDLGFYSRHLWDEGYEDVRNAKMVWPRPTNGTMWASLRDMIRATHRRINAAQRA